MNSQIEAELASMAQQIALQITCAAQEICAVWTAPSLIHNPSLLKDGDMWCALFGDNLQVGIAGFGPTPATAMAAFDAAWHTESGSHIIDRREMGDD